MNIRAATLSATAPATRSLRNPPQLRFPRARREALIYPWDFPSCQIVISSGLQTHTNRRSSFGIRSRLLLIYSDTSHQEISSMTATDALKGADNWQSSRCMTNALESSVVMKKSNTKHLFICKVINRWTTQAWCVSTSEVDINPLTLSIHA